MAYLYCKENYTDTEMVFCYQNCSYLLWEKNCSTDREKLEMYLLKALLDMREDMGEIPIQFYIMHTQQNVKWNIGLKIRQP